MALLLKEKWTKILKTSKVKVLESTRHIFKLVHLHTFLFVIVQIEDLVSV